ncbi:MAG: mechanosensitive ion channel [Desulfobacterales bacterium]|nr:mechanosensitive ion channel [Desulfobacterales bacterium]
MTIRDFFSQLADLFSKPLFTISGTEVTFFSIIVFILTVLFSIVISLVLQRGLKRALTHKFVKKEGALAALLRLFHYTIIIIGFAIGLQTIGINISALFAAGAVFAIAIGFAMQNIVQNFVAGVILLLERSIKPGDILEVEGTVVKVITMGIRTTVVRTWKEEELIMPNSIFSQSTVKNYTLRDNEFRLGVVVGVSYGSDMKKVIEVLEKTAADLPWRLPEPKPRVLLQAFGNSSVDFGVYINIDEPWSQRIYKADLRKKIWFAFKKANITIAFPQLDVHLDPPVSEAITNNLRKIK